ncbi:hypothetical protein [uncultured Helicobacter sp.]
MTTARNDTELEAIHSHNDNTQIPQELQEITQERLKNLQATKTP